MTASYTWTCRLPFPAADNQSTCAPGRSGVLLQCNEAGRAALMVVGPQFMRDFPLRKAVPCQPSVGAADGAVDMVGRAREIVG